MLISFLVTDYRAREADLKGGLWLIKGIEPQPGKRINHRHDLCKIADPAQVTNHKAATGSVLIQAHLGKWYWFETPPSRVIASRRRSNLIVLNDLRNRAGRLPRSRWSLAMTVLKSLQSPGKELEWALKRRSGTAIVRERNIAGHGVGAHKAAGRVGGVFTNDESKNFPSAAEIELFMGCYQSVVTIVWCAIDFDITACNKQGIVNGIGGVGAYRRIARNLDIFGCNQGSVPRVVIRAWTA